MIASPANCGGVFTLKKMADFISIVQTYNQQKTALWGSLIYMDKKYYFDFLERLKIDKA